MDFNVNGFIIPTGYKEVVEVLVQSHAKINVINKVGHSALDAAVALNATEGSQLLW